MSAETIPVSTPYNTIDTEIPLRGCAMNDEGIANLTPISGEVMLNTNLLLENPLHFTPEEDMLLSEQIQTALDEIERLDQDVLGWNRDIEACGERLAYLDEVLEDVDHIKDEPSKRNAITEEINSLNEKIHHADMYNKSLKAWIAYHEAAKEDLA